MADRKSSPPIKLAGAWKPCSAGGSEICAPAQPGDPCTKCGGTGRVYFFPDAVRILCPCYGAPSRKQCVKCYLVAHSEKCVLRECEGREWIPTTDESVWWACIPTAFPKANLVLSTCIDSQKLRHWRLQDKYTKVYKCDQDALWLLLHWAEWAVVAAGGVLAA